MNQLNNLSKLSTILKAFGYGQTRDKSPKLWNLDTDILSILESFRNKILNSNIDIFNDNLIKVSDFGLNSKGNKSYKLHIKNINVTPSKKDDVGVAYNTLSQYLRILNYFDLIIVDSFEKIADLINNHGEFYLSISMFDFLYSSSLIEWLSLEKIVDFIAQGINKTIDGYKDIAFSLFMASLNKIDREFVEIYFETNSLNYKRSRNDHENITDYLEKIYTDTYKKLVDCLINQLKIVAIKNNQSILDCLFELIYSRLNNNQIKLELNSFIFDDNQKTRMLEQEYQIQNFRSKLRENIIKTRKPTDDKYYSDITPIDDSIVFYHDSYEQQEAAHILDVWRIKDNFEINDESLNYLSDPNNGILIDHIYHDALDSGWISFNTKGEMVPKDKWIEYYGSEIMSQKYPLMKIKDEVFNDSMKQYLISRNSIPGTKYSK